MADTGLSSPAIVCLSREDNHIGFSNARMLLICYLLDTICKSFTFNNAMLMVCAPISISRVGKLDKRGICPGPR